MTSSSSSFRIGRYLVFDQPPIVFLRRGLQLPLVLEQRGLVDVLEDFAQIEVLRLQHAHAPERRLRNVRRRRNLDVRRGRAVAVAAGDSRARELLHHLAFGDALLARAIRRRQVFHDVQPGKGIVGIEDAAGVFAAQIVFHVLARERRAAADHRELQLLVMQVLHHVLHLQRGLHQQSAQPDGVGLLLASAALMMVSDGCLMPRFTTR